MVGELILLGLFVSPVLPGALLGWVLSLLVRRELRRRSFYRWVWHPALFDLCVTVTCAGLVLGAFHALTGWLA